MKNAEKDGSEPDGIPEFVTSDMIWELIGLEDTKERLKNMETDSEKISISDFNPSDYIDWSELSYNCKLDESFIEEYADYIHWSGVSKNSKLSEPFIDKWSHRVNWYLICMHQELSEDFIDNHKDKVFWSAIAINQKLSEQFIEKHADKLFWESVLSNQVLSSELILKHREKISYKDNIIVNGSTLQNLLETAKLVLEFQKTEEAKLTEALNLAKKKLLEMDSLDKEIAAIIKKLNLKCNVHEFSYIHEIGPWFSISAKCKLSERFIREFKDRVDWHWISRSQKLSEGFIEEFEDKVDWKYISECQKLSESFIKKHKDKVDWQLISQNQLLSREFIIENSRLLDWNSIGQNSETLKKLFN